MLLQCRDFWKLDNNFVVAESTIQAVHSAERVVDDAARTEEHSGMNEIIMFSLVTSLDLIQSVSAAVPRGVWLLSFPYPKSISAA